MKKTLSILALASMTMVSCGKIKQSISDAINLVNQTTELTEQEDAVQIAVVDTLVWEEEDVYSWEGNEAEGVYDLSSEDLEIDAEEAAALLEEAIDNWDF